MSARFVVALGDALATVPPADSVPPATDVVTTDPAVTTPPDTAPVDTVPLDPQPVFDTTKSTGAAVWDVFANVFDALGDNGYQTGTAVIVATAALVVLLNLGTNKFAVGAVVVGAFWAGWLGWNTFTDNDNQLFPGDIQATKLWDVAFTSDIGFLFVAVVSCVLAALLWRTGIGLASRVVVLIGGIMGASLIYNLYESVRAVSDTAS
ncbi:MAG: hypothetical protein AB8G14_15260 [Ilumatobacter sp.]